MFDGHGTRHIVTPGLAGRSRVLGLRVAAALALANLAFWGWQIARVRPSPVSEFADRRSTTVWTENGMQIDLCHDCTPMLVLAGRDFGRSYEDARFIGLATTVNPIGLLASSLTIGIAEPLFGYHGAMWVGSAAFIVGSSAQWWAFGWLAVFRLTRRQRVSEALKATQY